MVNLKVILLVGHIFFIILVLQTRLVFTDIQGCSERITASVFILSAVNPESKGFNVATY